MTKSELQTRKICWEIIKKSSSRNRRLSDVTIEYFSKDEFSLDLKDKRFITMLVQGSVRMKGRLDWEIKQVFNGDYSDLKDNIKILLRIGIYQIKYMDSVPDYAAVATTVQLAKRLHNKLGGLANAILRTIIKTNKKLNVDPKMPLDELSEYLSHPEWLFSKWAKDFSINDAINISKWNNTVPNLWFRINQMVYTPERFIKYLDKENIEYKIFKHIPEFINTTNGQDLLNSDLFNDGKISVQDPSAGLVVKLLNPKVNEVIVDVCSAPGGKSSYIAEILKNTGSIFSYDSDIRRLNKLNNTILRLNLNNIETEVIDVTVGKIEKCDKMLIDAPCSGTGVMSKRADLRWRRSVDDILEMHLLQRKILWSASNYINPNGVIIYSTCSIEYEENYMVIDAFLKSHPKFSIEPANDYVPKEFIDDRGAINILPHHHNIDGGFAIRLRNNA